MCHLYMNCTYVCRMGGRKQPYHPFKILKYKTEKHTKFVQPFSHSFINYHVLSISMPVTGFGLKLGHIINYLTYKNSRALAMWELTVWNDLIHPQMLLGIQSDTRPHSVIFIYSIYILPFSQRPKVAGSKLNIAILINT